MEQSRTIALRLVGMPEEQALAVAQAEGRFVRVATGDGMSGEAMPARVTLWVDDGVVVRAEAG